MSTNEPTLLKTQPYSDDRGSLRPIKLPFNPNGWEQLNVVHTNIGFVRGLHWQDSPFDQGKYIIVMYGLIKDVVINLITGTQNSYEMEEGDLLWVPRGYAHGFCALEDSLVTYLVDNIYQPSAERGMNPFCQELAINWGIVDAECNTRDRAFPGWSDRFK